MGKNKWLKYLPIGNEIAMFKDHVSKIKHPDDWDSDYDELDVFGGMILRFAYFALWAGITMGITNKAINNYKIKQAQQKVIQLENQQYEKEINASYNKDVENSFHPPEFKKYLKENIPHEIKEKYVLEKRKQEILKREGLEGKTGWWNE